MEKEKINILMPIRTKDILDKEAKNRGMSRTGIINWIISEWLKELDATSNSD